MKATVSHNLFNWCSVISHMMTQRYGQNEHGIPKMQYLCKIVQWAWPDIDAGHNFFFLITPSVHVAIFLLLTAQ